MQLALTEVLRILGGVRALIFERQTEASRPGHKSDRARACSCRLISSVRRCGWRLGAMPVGDRSTKTSVNISTATRR